jgi:large subunit ribosomal protein L10
MKGRQSVLRSEKQNLIASLNQTFGKTTLVVVSHYSGLTVAETEALRSKVREAGAGFKVTKNRLTRIALKGTSFEGLDAMFKGPTAMTYSADPVAAARVTVEFAKSNEKLCILGGALGDKLLNAEGIKALASLPSIDELRGQFLGLLMTPATRIATLSQAPAAQLARVLRAYADKE